MDYLKRFEAMKKEIESHPFLEVVEYKVNKPASKEAFKKVEDLLKTKLADPIESFYSQANGLKFRWRIKQALSEKELEKLSEKYDDYTFEPDDDDEDQPFAFINLLPLEDSILKKKWEEIEIGVKTQTFEFGNKTYPRVEFAKRLKPFDLFSLSNCMAFLIEEGKGNPEILQLQDYYIVWDNSRKNETNPGIS